jgi:hypothetical protein
MWPIDDQTLSSGLLRTSELDEATRAALIDVCVDAHREPDYVNRFGYLPAEARCLLRALGREGGASRWRGRSDEGLIPTLISAALDPATPANACAGTPKRN